MDEATEHKIRNLKLQILRVEKEIASKQHGANLNAFLSVGHAGQIARANERERKRLEEKLEKLKAQLVELDPTAAAAPPPPAPVKPEPKAVPAPKAKAAPKATSAKPAAKPAPKKKAAPVKSETASKSAKKPAKKK
ncbi:MAG: hypothetical protein ACOZB3_06555 [Calditrichota bacterium]